ncbi:MAG: hypothetical protein JST00_06510 [Deltaproteobacteria bacterium]|nr:hypothetical protein [Deltaproteobacteria bacterium]
MWKHALVASALCLAASACAAGDEPGGDPDDVLVDDLSFFSNVAREFTVTGESSVEVESSYDGRTPAIRRARAMELVKLKNMQIAWFLGALLVEKDKTDKNNKYGGYGGLVGFGSEPEADVREEGGRRWRFKYRVTVAGIKELISKLPGENAGEGSKTFRLAMGRLSNEEMAKIQFGDEWYEQAPWKAFDPSKVPADRLEYIDLRIAPAPRSEDAYLAHDRLFEDGVLTVAVHFGYDYYTRFDTTGSRQLYNILTKDRGFTSPAAQYKEYLRSSGPLTKTITSNGHPIQVRLWIYHPGNAPQDIPGPDPNTDDGGKQLEADMRASLREKEVVIFSGHSGPTYAFALANWKKTAEGDLDDTEIPGLTLPSTYQIVMADGCDTYALGAAFWQNPAKADRKNLNVITTTSFSNAGYVDSTLRMVDAVTNVTGGKFVAQTLSQLTRGFDRDQGEDFKTMYGVHGVDANPKYDPLAKRSSLCKPCRANDECGGDGNRCTRLSSRQAACTYGCAADSGCPDGYACTPIGSVSAQTVKTRQCVPISKRCE